MPACREPPAGTVEGWCWALVTGVEPGAKLAPPPPPEAWEHDAPPRRLEAPGRPAAWAVARRAPRSVKKGALGDPGRRCELVATFLHHELQAAELMAWALLAWPAAPTGFRRGLLAICREELAHLAMYRGYLREHGHEVGDWPVRDWFWQRVPSAQTPAQFAAVMGLGLEGGNLDHCARYARWFREAGDAAGAAMLARVQEDEVGHVAFAARWFRELTGGLDFEAWAAALPPPLTPTVFKGRPVNRRDRARAGLDEDFLARLEAWSGA